MKNPDLQRRTAAGHGEAGDAGFSPVDLVDQIQRKAFRERFNRAPDQAYPSLDRVRRAIAESH